MKIERRDFFKLGNQFVTIVGDDLQPGQVAPEFTAHANDWSIFHGLGDTSGKVHIIAAVPSLNTSVCDRETRRFNQEAASLSDDIIIVVVSTDLPYAQRTWCGAAGVDKVITVSDHYDTNFGEKYGVLIKERRILRRAVFVVDRLGKVAYAAYMPSLGDEPDYAAVLAAAQNALA